jgi:8-oxo-dGTP diphosphatase
VIEVVSAVLVRHHRIFLQQRPALKDFGFAWESPGGKVDGNETCHQALLREGREELGIEIHALPADLKPVWTGTFENMVLRAERAAVAVHFYLVGDAFSGEPVAREDQPGMGFFTPEEMLALSLCHNLSPANERAKQYIAAAVRSCR